MYPTRRATTTAAVGLALAAIAVVTARPEAAVGAAGIGAWLLATAAAAVRSFRRADATLAVRYDAPAAAVDDDPVVCTLAVERTGARDCEVVVRAATPPGATDVDEEAATVVLEPGRDAADTAFDLSFLVAGTHSFPEPAVTITDPLGLYTERLQTDGAPTVTVEARAPRRIHVGRGGQRLATSYAEHASEATGAGQLFAELREYVSGDQLNRIDWKATARLGTPHVRKFETETDRRTVMLVDGRGRMATGPSGGTMADYARAVSLSFARLAQSEGDPLGLYVLGDDGLTTVLDAARTSREYARVRTALRDLEPAGAAGVRADGESVRTVREVTPRLAGEDRFARTLSAFATARGLYEETDRSPLIAGLRRIRSRSLGVHRYVIVTDDSDRATLERAVTFAAERASEVLVICTPRALFEPGGLADIDEAYDRYVEFERFRTRLEGHANVRAFEVAPRDRFDALLSGR